MNNSSLFWGLSAIAVALAVGWVVLGRLRRRRNVAAGAQVTSRPLFEDKSTTAPAVPATADFVLPSTAAQLAADPAASTRGGTGFILDVSPESQAGPDRDEGPSAKDSPIVASPRTLATVELPTDPVGRAHAYDDSQRGLDEVREAADAQDEASAENQVPKTAEEKLRDAGLPVFQNNSFNEVTSCVETGDTMPGEPPIETLSTDDPLPPLQDPVTPVPEGVLQDPTGEPVAEPAPTPSAYSYANPEQLVAAVQAYRLPGRTKVPAKAKQYRDALKVFLDEAWQNTDPAIKGLKAPWVRSSTTGTESSRRGGDYVYWVHLFFKDIDEPVKIKLTSTR